MRSTRGRRRSGGDAGWSRQISDMTAIVHLAAQAGVRHSLVDPYAVCAVECDGPSGDAGGRAPAAGVAAPGLCQFVIGLWRQPSLPFGETDRVDTPLSVYAATKRADELMSHAYAHLFGLPQTGLRFFTVYGPWGRPDMAYYSFAERSSRASRSRSTRAGRCGGISPTSTTSWPGWWAAWTGRPRAHRRRGC